MLRISVVDVLLPSDRKFRIQLQREVFSPRVFSLVMSLEGSMALNAEL